MDQIVFIFDLEQLVPLGNLVEEDESLVEARLNSIKQAALRIALLSSDAGKNWESGRNLPSLGFRLVNQILT